MIECIHLYTKRAPRRYDNLDGSLYLSICKLESSTSGFNPVTDCLVPGCPCRIHPVIKPLVPDHNDPCGPPAVPVQVRCMHCDEVYMSSEMVYGNRFGSEFRFGPIWWCKNPQCSGRGYGFDIHQVKQ